MYREIKKGINANKYPAKNCATTLTEKTTVTEHQNTTTYPDNIVLDKNYYTIPDIADIIMAATGMADSKTANGQSRRKILKGRIKGSLNRLAKKNHIELATTPEYDDGRPIQTLYPKVIVQAMFDTSRIIPDIDAEIPMFDLNPKYQATTAPEPQKPLKPTKLLSKKFTQKIPAADNCLRNIQLSNDCYTISELLDIVLHAAKVKISTKTKKGKKQRLKLTNHMRKAIKLLAKNGDMNQVTTADGLRVTYTKAVAERLLKSDTYAKYIYKLQVSMGIKIDTYFNSMPKPKSETDDKKLANMIAVLTKSMSDLILDCEEYTARDVACILIATIRMRFETNINERSVLGAMKARVYNHLESKSLTSEIHMRRDPIKNKAVKHYTREAIYRTVQSLDFIERLAAYLIKEGVSLDVINDQQTPDEFLDTVVLSKTYYTIAEIIELTTKATGIMFNSATPVTDTEMTATLKNALDVLTPENKDKLVAGTQYPAYAIMTVLNSAAYRQQLRNADWLYTTDQPVLTLPATQETVTNKEPAPVAPAPVAPAPVAPAPVAPAPVAPAPVAPANSQVSTVITNMSDEIKHAVQKIATCTCDNNCKKCPLLIMRQLDSGYCLRAVLSMRISLD